VLVEADDDELLAARPADFAAATARFFGLEKPEAGALVDTFGGM
jgi:hypothetical protein